MVLDIGEEVLLVHARMKSVTNGIAKVSIAAQSVVGRRVGLRRERVQGSSVACHTYSRSPNVVLESSQGLGEEVFDTTALVLGEGAVSSNSGEEKTGQQSDEFVMRKLTCAGIRTVGNIESLGVEEEVLK